MRRFNKTICLVLTMTLFVAMAAMPAMASAALDAGSLALEAEAVLDNTTYVYTEDFNDWEIGSVASKGYSDNPTNANYIGLATYGEDVNNAMGTIVDLGNGDKAYKIATAWTGALYIRVPGFFKDKVNGNFTVKCDIKLARKLYTKNSDDTYTEYTVTKSPYMTYYKIPETVNAGSSQFKSEYGLGYGTDPSGEFKTTTKTFAYIKTAIDAGKDPDKYDADALAIAIFPNNGVSGTLYEKNGDTYTAVSGNAPLLYVDNIVITAPAWAERTLDRGYITSNDVTIENTIYNNDKVAAEGKVINALYDANGNLKTVGTNNFSISATDTTKTVTVTLPKTSGTVTDDWTYRAYLWTDLNSEIKPLASADVFFDGNLLPNGSFEIYPVGTVPTAVSNDDLAFGWRNYHANYLGSVTTEDVTFTGKHSLKIAENTYVNTNTGSSTDDNIMQKILFDNGINGKYVIDLWAKLDDGASLGLNINAETHWINGANRQNQTGLLYMYGTDTRTLTSSVTDGTTTKERENTAEYIESLGEWKHYRYTFDVSNFNSVVTTTAKTNARFAMHASGGNVYVDDIKMTFVAN